MPPHTSTVIANNKINVGRCRDIRASFCLRLRDCLRLKSALLIEILLYLVLAYLL